METYSSGQRKRRVTIDGVDFEVGVLSMRACGRLQAYINDLEHPRLVEKARAMAEGMDAESAKNLMTVASIQEFNWPPQVVTAPQEAFAALIGKEEGWNLFLTTVLHESRPDIPSATLAQVVDKVDTDQFEQLWMASLGIARPDLVVNEARSRLCLFSEDAVHDFTRGVIASLDVDTDPKALDEALERMPLGQYGTVAELTMVKGVPSVPKSAEAPRRGSRK